MRWCRPGAVTTPAESLQLANHHPLAGLVCVQRVVHDRGMITSEPLTEPTQVTLDAAPTAVVRHERVTLATLRPLFDSGFMAIAASGASINGPAFALYRGDTGAEFDLDLGFPVAEPLAQPVRGVETVEPSQLPAGSAWALSHLGAYGSLHESWGRLDEHVRGLGLTPSGLLEVYVTEPSPEIDPTTLRTDLFLLV